MRKVKKIVFWITPWEDTFPGAGFTRLKERAGADEVWTIRECYGPALTQAKSIAEEIRREEQFFEYKIQMIPDPIYEQFHKKLIRKIKKHLS